MTKTKKTSLRIRSLLSPGALLISLCLVSGLLSAPPKVPRSTERPTEEKKDPVKPKEDPGITITVKKKQPEKKPAPKKKPKKAKGDEHNFDYDANVFNLDLNHKRGLVDRIQWKLTFQTSFNYFNNADLRELSETNETTIENTDDRMYFIVSGVELRTFFPVNKHLDFSMDLYKMGFWGHDQLGGRDNNNDQRDTFNGTNAIAFGNLNFNVHFWPSANKKQKVDLIIGRQPFEIGGHIENDFFQRDTLDAVVLSGAYKQFGTLDLLIIDVFSSGSKPEGVNFVQYLSHDNEKVDGFDGDVNTYRSGFVYKNSVIGDSALGGTHVEARIFYFFAKFGGVNQGGSERSNSGNSGNFADNDYSVMRGGRLNAGWKEYVRISATYAESFGQDRKRPANVIYNQDVDNNGTAIGLEGEFSYDMSQISKKWLPFSTSLFLGYFRAKGGRYYIDGTQYSHGFVSMKGDQTGGIIGDLNYGLHPSAYIDDDGIDDWPYDRDRKTGTEVTRVGWRINVGKTLKLKADVWWFKDTNSSKLLDGSEDTLVSNLLLILAQPTYQSQTTVMAAQRRFGQDLGREINFGLEHKPYTYWKWWMTVGWFDPGPYFATPGLISGAPEGPTRATGFQMGTSFYF